MASNDEYQHQNEWRDKSIHGPYKSPNGFFFIEESGEIDTVIVTEVFAEMKKDFLQVYKNDNQKQAN